MIAPRRTTPEQGFTLIEVMVAVVIVSIIFLGLYGVLIQTMQDAKFAQDRVDVYADGRSVVLRIADEIESALPPSVDYDIYFRGTQGTGLAAMDAVEFFRVIQRQGAASQLPGGRAYVRYALEPMRDVAGVFALHRYEEVLVQSRGEDGGAALADTGLAPAQTRSAAYLLDNVVSLRFQYFDPGANEFVESWDTLEEVDGVWFDLPVAVRVTLTLVDGDGGLHDFTTVVDLVLANVAVPTP